MTGEYRVQERAIGKSRTPVAASSGRRGPHPHSQADVHVAADREAQSIGADWALQSKYWANLMHPEPLPYSAMVELVASEYRSLAHPS